MIQVEWDVPGAAVVAGGAFLILVKRCDRYFMCGVSVTRCLN